MFGLHSWNHFNTQIWTVLQQLVCSFNTASTAQCIKNLILQLYDAFIVVEIFFDRTVCLHKSLSQWVDTDFEHSADWGDSCSSYGSVLDGFSTIIKQKRVQTVCRFFPGVCCQPWTHLQWRNINEFYLSLIDDWWEHWIQIM